jgi:membrane-bound inhibitor of C-type lysozyme
VTYACDGDPRNAVTATFFPTDPPTAMAEHGDQVSFMVQQPAASGAKYQGRIEPLWEHQDEARITWGDGSPEMPCSAKGNRRGSPRYLDARDRYRDFTEIRLR